VTGADLRDAIKKSGNSALAVKAELAGAHDCREEVARDE
jgi:hypothetical protein